MKPKKGAHHPASYPKGAPPKANPKKILTPTTPTKSTSTKSTSTSSGNQPRNILLTNAANVPLVYEFDIPNLRNHVKIHVRQQDNEETWPGGAIWDLGILLASVCVACAGGSACTLTLLEDNSGANTASKPKQYPTQLPERFLHLQKGDPWFRRFWTPSCNQNMRWVELGCGVGLTGLVAAAALRPHAILLTDLDVVVQQVTQPNTLANQALFKGTATTQCRALPLCWGDSKDLDTVGELLESLYKPATNITTSKSSRKKTKAVSSQQSAATTTTSSCDEGRKRCADVVLIGDVAYQHKPGAPSHFDVLHETLLQLLHDDTLVIFGTRIRMPASVDLLELFRNDLEEVVSPPLSADEIDPASFGKVKHNMTVHFMRKRRSKLRGTTAATAAAVEE